MTLRLGRIAVVGTGVGPKGLSNYPAVDEPLALGIPAIPVAGLHPHSLTGIGDYLGEDEAAIAGALQERPTFGRIHNWLSPIELKRC